MKELFLKQAEIFEKYNIVITYFAYLNLKGDYEYRTYFKDLNNKYLHNPLQIEKLPGNKFKTSYSFHNSLKESLEWVINEAETYVKESRPVDC